MQIKWLNDRRFGKNSKWINLAILALYILALGTFGVASYTSIAPTPAQAAGVTCYWVGDTSPANWNDATHWSVSTGGTISTCAGTGGVPGTADTAIFDSANINSADINSAASITALTISAGYTGTITIQAAQSLTASGAFTINDGVFTTGNQNFTVDSFTMAGGVFNAGSSTVTVNGNFTHTVATGTYNEDTSTIIFFNPHTHDHTLDFNTSETFNNVQFNSTYSAWGTTITSGDTMVVSGDLTITKGYVKTGTIDARGNIIQNGGHESQASTAIIDFGAAGAQTYTINAAYGPQLRFDSDDDKLDSIILNADGGLRALLITADFGNANTVLTDYNNHNLSLSSVFTQASGTFDASTSMTIGGTFTLSDGVFNAGTTTTFNSNFTHTTATGTYNEGANTVFYNPGVSDITYNVNNTESFNNVEFKADYWQYGTTITSGDTMVVNGDLTLTSGHVNTGTVDVRGNIIQNGMVEGGTGIIDFGAAGAQTYIINAGSGPQLRFDSDDDKLDSIILNADGGLNGLLITAAFGNANTVLTTYNNHNLTVTTEYNQASGTFNASASMAVRNTLTLSGGIFNGATSMTIGYDNGAGNFTLSNGTFNAPTTITFIGNFTHTTATGTYNEGATTIINRNWVVDRTFNFNVTEAFNDVEITGAYAYTTIIASGDTMVVNGNLTLTNGYVGTGTVDAKGNVTVANGFDGGNALMKFSGSGNQAYTMAGVPTTGVVAFNKSTGDMTVENSSTTARTIIMSSATQNFANLYLSASNTANLTLAGATNNPTVNISGNFDFTGAGAGTEVITMGSHTWTVTGNVDFTAGTVTAGGSTLALNSSSAGQTLTAATNSLNNLTIANTHTDGVTFTDDATVAGTFINTTGSSKMTFNSGSTYAFNTVNIAGAADHLIALAPSGATNWTFNPTTVTSVSYVSVSKSTNTGPAFCATYSTDSGGNTDWNIGTGIYCGFDVSGTITNGSSGLSGVLITATKGATTKTATTAVDGTYTLTDCYNGTWLLTPSKFSQTFSPTTRDAVVSGADLPGQDFAATYVPPSFLSGWLHRILITVDHTKVGTGGVIDFPVLLTEANVPADFWTQVASDGKDIRITSDNGTTVLKNEMTSIDTTGHKLEVWWKAPALSDTDDTYAFLYWGNSSATMPSVADQQAVWSNGYGASYHAKEPSGLLADSTANGNNLTAGGTVGYSESGVVGNAVSTNGSSGYFGKTSPVGIDNAISSWSAWIKPDTLGSNRTLFSRWPGGSSQGQIIEMISTLGNVQVDIPYVKGSVLTAANGTITTGGWQLVTVTRTSGGLWTLYKNGSYVNSNTDASAPALSGSLCLGATACSTGFFDTAMDEMRVGNGVAWTQAWVTTDYNTQYSPTAFYSLSGEESGKPAAPTDVAISGIDSTYFDVTWTDASSDETGFKVYISTTPNATCSAATYPVDPDYTAAADAVSQAVTGKSINTQYCAKVIAAGTSGDSDPAYAAAAKYTLANVPSAPTLSDPTMSSIKITVNKNSNPDANTRYAIYNDTESKYVKHADGTLQTDPDWQLYADWGGASGFTNIDLTASTLYTYKVKAENGDNTATAFSVTAQATIQDEPTPTPTPTPMPTPTPTPTPAPVVSIQTSQPAAPANPSDNPTVQIELTQTATVSGITTTYPNGTKVTIDGEKVTVEGTATPDATIEILIDGKTYSTKADIKGNWIIEFTQSPGDYKAQVTFTDPNGTAENQYLDIKIPGVTSKNNIPNFVWFILIGAVIIGTTAFILHRRSKARLK